MASQFLSSQATFSTHWYKNIKSVQLDTVYKYSNYVLEKFASNKNHTVGYVACPSKPNTQEAKTIGFQVSGQPVLYSKTLSQKRKRPQTIKKSLHKY